MTASASTEGGLRGACSPTSPSAHSATSNRCTIVASRRRPRPSRISKRWTSRCRTRRWIPTPSSRSSIASRHPRPSPSPDRATSVSSTAVRCPARSRSTGSPRRGNSTARFACRRRRARSSKASLRDGRSTCSDCRADSALGFVTGTTVAHMTCLVAARQALLERVGWNADADGLFGAPPITVIVGAETHSTMLKALGVVGFGRARVVRVPVDAQGRMRADAMPAIVGPTIVCVQAGNVNTGACDPIREIIEHVRALRRAGVGPRRRRIRSVGTRRAGTRPSRRRRRARGLVGDGRAQMAELCRTTAVWRSCARPRRCAKRWRSTPRICRPIKRIRATTRLSRRVARAASTSGARFACSAVRARRSRRTQLPVGEAICRCLRRRGVSRAERSRAQSGAGQLRRRHANARRDRGDSAGRNVLVRPDGVAGAHGHARQCHLLGDHRSRCRSVYRCHFAHCAKELTLASRMSNVECRVSTPD